MHQEVQQLITSFIQFPVTLLSNLPDALIFRGEMGGKARVLGEGEHREEEGKPAPSWCHQESSLTVSLKNN